MTSCKSSKKTVKTRRKHSKVVVKKNDKPDSTSIYRKYSEKLGIEVDEKSNIQLLELVIEWMGTPYKYGECSKNGTDCSGLTHMIYRDIYSMNINRSCQSILDQCRVISEEDLKEGDLVFFKIEQPKASHVGVFLRNNKFVHATTKKGVMISDLNEPYYRKYFYKAGTLLH